MNTTRTTSTQRKITGIAAAVFLLAFLALSGGCSVIAGAAVIPQMTTAAVTVSATPEPTPSPTPAPTPTPSPVPTHTPTPTPEPTSTPDPDAQYFSESGEVVVVNPDGKHWLYQSPTMGVSIERIDDSKKKIACYIADIHVRDFTLIGSGFANKKPQGSPRQTPEDIAKLYKAVFAQNGDYYTHSSAAGLVIRDGVAYRDKKQKDDVMAFAPDGEMLVFHTGETTAEKLLALGVTDAFSFGPILVEDGKVGTLKNSHSIAGVNPRSGIGMVKPGHYIGIVVDAGTPERRGGLKLADFAQLFIDRGCVVAYNFDGGQSSSMVFMGEAINTPVKHVDGKNWNGQRKVPDIFRIGESEQVK